MYILLLLIGFVHAELQSISACQDGTMTTWVDANLQSITFGIGDLLVERGLNVGGTEKDAGDGNIKADGTITAKDVAAETITIGTPVTSNWDGAPKLDSYGTEVWSDVRVHGDMLFTNDHSRLMVNEIGGAGGCPYLDTPKAFDACSASKSASINFNSLMEGEFAESVTDETRSSADIAIFGEKLFIKPQTYIYQGLHVDDEFTAADKKFSVDATGKVRVDMDLVVGDDLGVGEDLLVEGQTFCKGGLKAYGDNNLANTKWKNIWGYAGSSASWFSTSHHSLNYYQYGDSQQKTMSIWAESYIGTEWGLLTMSDRRIKTNIVDVDDISSLRRVLDIPVRNYQYKDKLRRGIENVTGFIAQEVREVFPEAVSLVTDFIPFHQIIYTIDHIEQNTVIISTFKGEDELKKDDVIKVTFHKPDGKMIRTEAKVFQVDSEKTYLSCEKCDKGFKDADKVYVSDKQVDDFHRIDKQRIFTLHHGAIQELHEQQQILQEKVATLEDTVAKLSERLAALEAR